MAPPPNSGDAKNTNDDDPLGGMDPMAWLESLAARQGAKAEELTTAANLDIPLPPADTVMAPPPNPGDAKNANDDDPLGGMDPMEWLESLAARQGAKAEELTTSANLDIPMPPADTVVDEPGYTPGYDTGKPAAKTPEAP